MRRLSHLGALPLKRSAYLLPASDSAFEDLQWLRQEIVAAGGDAWILESRFLGGLEDEEIRRRFRSICTPRYREIAADARSILDRRRGTGTEGEERSALEVERRRLGRRIDAMRNIDFFHADGRDEVEALMSAIDRSADGGSRGSTPSPDVLQGRTWATRAGVKVDRMASAWLIRRFIDPAARFMFVHPDGPPVAAGVLRFDMFEGEFTHQGDRCTFEVLLDASAHAADHGLRAIAQMVHDLDLRDDRYQRAETAGLAALLGGIISRFDDDARRLSEGAGIFETLYASVSGASGRP